MVVKKENTSFVVPTVPIVDIPSKKVATTIKIDHESIGLNNQRDIGIAVLLNTVALSTLKHGDRVSVSGEFDVIIIDAKIFPTYKKVFDTYDAELISPGKSIEEAVADFRTKYTYGRETRRGVIVLRMRRL